MFVDYWKLHLTLLKHQKLITGYFSIQNAGLHLLKCSLQFCFWIIPGLLHFTKFVISTNIIVFYPRPCLHGLGYCRALCRPSVCPSVCLSVCPSVHRPCVQDNSSSIIPRITKCSQIVCYTNILDEFGFQ